MKKGGSILISALLIDFKKRLATQNAKIEFFDNVAVLCVLKECEEGELCSLRPCVDNGNLIQVSLFLLIIWIYHIQYIHA